MKYKPPKKSNAVPVGGKVAPDVALYLDHKDLQLDAMGMEEASELISNLKSIDFLQFLGRVNTALQVSGTEDVSIQCALAAILLPPESRAIVGQRRAAWVTPWHLRQVIGWTLECEESHQLSMEDPEVRLRFGRLLSSLFDLRFSDVHSSDANNFVAVSMKMGRNNYQRMSSNVALEMKEHIVHYLTENSEIELLFQEKWGVSISQYSAAMFALASRLMSHGGQFLLQGGGSNVDLALFLGQLKARPALYRLVRDSFCIPVQSGKTIWPAVDPSQSISEIAKRPFILVDDYSLICLDYEFAFERYFRGLWNLLSEATKPTRINISELAGEAFQSFCRSLLSEILHERLNRSAKLVPNLERTQCKLDDLYVEGMSAMAFEYKSGVISASADWFGTDADRVAKSIEEKFIFGGESHGKFIDQGFAQVAKHLVPALERPGDFELQGVKRIRPCVVVEDEALTGIFISQWISLKAQPLFESLPVQIEKPLLISIRELGMMRERANWEHPMGISRTALDSPWGMTNMARQIEHYFPERQGEPWGRYKRKKLRLPILNRSLDELRDNVITVPTKQCNRCTKLCSLENVNGAERWWCGNCEAPLSTAPTSEELERFHREVEAIRTAFISSLNNPCS